mmetsp:Transcript_28160/g.46335  ORF Transcript_28160/g.46335 Transcript_28160/m.46335 type:complete len:314 (-) Transcript_28160:14-955(-)|eukprot:CAMPEP_0202700492 /NCGR_PEP_ID=MMETSP1385-20130828/13667_1 /ASSEMBLY_ACC=CAM_ASM_000861 /TAXON_ID=933848 /ORGANISM="Elphidium margaritaceum" /LENGTH=313 /DNA_ID=CAMNT_0049357685 /DNA_START=37 /DNA_END=978 /DNA_ORIENTATION=+
MEDDASFLVTIIDFHPSFWYQATQNSAPKKEGLAAHSFINNVLIFLNSFLTLHRGNKLAVIGINPKISKLIYLSQTQSQSEPPGMALRASSNKPKNGDDASCTTMTESALDTAQRSEFSYVDMNHKVATAMQEITMYYKNDAQQKCANGSLLAGGLSHALCILNKVLTKDLPHIDARVLVLCASNDISSQYIPLMNCIFSAQKLDVCIDACVLTTNDSLFLQQASHLTHGIYSKPPYLKGLIQHLLMTYLPSKAVRKHLCLPSTQNVDFRASCFCHQKPIDIGVVCPVCLSIFCEQHPLCKTCGTRFPRNKII